MPTNAQPPVQRHKGLLRLGRRPLGALLTLALALLVAACGGSDGGQDGAATGSDAPPVAGRDAFPVQVEHKYGVTEIDAAPQRVVTLGLSDHEPVLALGVKPVGAIDWYGERPYGIWPWTDELWGDERPEVVGQREDVDVEKIASLRPDVIIALYTGISEEQYSTLSRIAPTVAQPKDYDDYGAPWPVMTRVVGQTLGLSAQADKLVTDLEARFAAVRAEHPEFAGLTAAVADSTSPGQYSVFSPTDPKSVFMSELGFQIPDEIGELADGKFSVAISAERLDLVDVDRLVWLVGDDTVTQRITADSVYQELAVAREDRAIFLHYGRPIPLGGALSFGTVLSLPWAVDLIVPELTS